MDQALKKRRSITNAIGQLIRVDEPNDAGQLGDIASPNQPTNYEYDTLNNLKKVIQGIQTRTFTYDSLSRLKSANNPESGLITYLYDNNGNLTSKTDARNVVTNYIYDELNRVTNRNYTAPSPLPANYQATSNVTYTYDDPAVSCSKDKVTRVTNGFSETKYLGYDIMGRILSSQQITDGTTYNPMEYTYNLSGALIEENCP
jgi:YD repeat-containing protein